MRRRKLRDLLFLGLIVLLLIVLAYQAYRMMRPQSGHADAEQMLYEVSVFQIQVLNTSLLDAAHMNNTGELNALKLAAYSAAYTHERLVKSLGMNKLYSFPAIDGLIDLITTWQIGGNRPLSDAEKELIGKYSELFSNVVLPYQQLLSENGKVIASQDDQLEKTGKQLADLVKGR
ncbi:hypothetical protein [Paenibacillus chibensis]|uniref:hypothetical protein n=1 Tax=Paenibacillus chibensis TaxID=59846 RepID=UPI000FDB2F6C|nr:hypothetical protein [Paenibacillus chibensis]MEC0372347.1 hypothetical protein [Paenibacillus chibensis]